LFSPIKCYFSIAGLNLSAFCLGLVRLIFLSAIESVVEWGSIIGGKTRKNEPTYVAKVLNVLSMMRPRNST
jgi:hypothetical protein